MIGANILLAGAYLIDNWKNFENSGGVISLESLKYWPFWLWIAFAFMLFSVQVFPSLYLVMVKKKKEEVKI